MEFLPFNAVEKCFWFQQHTSLIEILITVMQCFFLNFFSSINQSIEGFQLPLCILIALYFILHATHIQMQIRYSNILVKEPKGDHHCQPRHAFTAITSFLHYEYSVHSHARMHGYIVCLRFMYTLLPSHSVIVCFVVFFIISSRTEHCRQAFSYHVHHFYCFDMSIFDV